MDSGRHVYCYTVTVNKTVTEIFLYKKTVLNVLNFYECICEQLIKLFKYALIKKKQFVGHNNYYFG